MGLRLPTQKERDDIILSLLKGKFSCVADGKARWEKGWAENRDAFFASGNPVDLVPKYIRPNMPVRYFGDFVYSDDPEYQRKWYEKFRAEFFQEWFIGFDTIFELGCGSGYNLAALKKMFPGAEIHGLDWAHASIDIALKLACQAHLFDFFNPDYSLEVPLGSIF